MKTQKTLVTIRQTKVKYVDNTTNEVTDIVLVGRLSVSECKDYVKNLGDSFTFILKENLTEQFKVDTIALTQLKEN